jgi:hypothetical protein
MREIFTSGSVGERQVTGASTRNNIDGLEESSSLSLKPEVLHCYLDDLSHIHIELKYKTF